MTNTDPRQLAAIVTDALLDGRPAALEALPALAAEIGAQFETALEACVARIQANHDADAATRSVHWPRCRYYVDARRKGQRFARIVAESVGTTANPKPEGVPGSRRVVGFVEVGTGLLYKAATFKAPATNFARGCIYNLPAEWAVGTFAVPSIG